MYNTKGALSDEFSSKNILSNHKKPGKGSSSTPVFIPDENDPQLKEFLLWVRTENPWIDTDNYPGSDPMSDLGKDDK